MSYLLEKQCDVNVLFIIYTCSILNSNMTKQTNTQDSSAQFNSILFPIIQHLTMNT